jgi:hypothetical protein
LLLNAVVRPSEEYSGLSSHTPFPRPGQPAQARAIDAYPVDLGAVDAREGRAERDVPPVPGTRGGAPVETHVAAVFTKLALAAHPDDNSRVLSAFAWLRAG